MITYTVHATWDPTGWWVANVIDLGPSASTQSRRLDQIERDIAEVIELLTDEPPGSYDLALTWDDPTGDADRARELRQRAEKLTNQAQQATTTAVDALRGAGMSYRDIGTMTGVSYQRAQQLATARRRTGAASG